MSTLRISLFGGVRVAHDGRPPRAKITHTVQALFAYLLLQPHRSQPREVLANLFWGDHRQDRARSCLNTTLWRLRHVLEPEGIPAGTYLIAMPSGEVSFNWESDHWLDTAVFEERIDRVLARPIDVMEASDAQDLENAVQLYVGELLEGFYDDWALRERERLRCLYLNSLAHLMRYYRQHGAYEKGLASGQQILNLDPLREEVHREMMWLYLESGQRVLAVRQYEICRELLVAELGITPMEETQAAYAQIAPKADQGWQRSTVMEQTGIQDILQQLSLTVHSLDRAREQLQRAIRFVEGITDRPH